MEESGTIGTVPHFGPFRLGWAVPTGESDFGLLIYTETGIEPLRDFLDFQLKKTVIKTIRRVALDSDKIEFLFV